MFTDWMWWIAYSYVSLAAIGIVLIAALVVGYFPLLKWFPIIGPYVPVGKLVSLLAASLLCFLVGARTADERQEAKQLKAENALLIKRLAATNGANETDAAQAAKDSERITDLGKKADETPDNSAPCFTDDGASERLRRIR